MTRTAKLEAPTISLDRPVAVLRAASAGRSGRPASEASLPAIDNELVAELESALQAVLTREPRPEAAEPEAGEPEPPAEAVDQEEAPAEIWYGPSAAAAEPPSPLLLRPAAAEPRPSPAWELDMTAEASRLGAIEPRRRRLPLRAALCVAGVLGIAGAGGVGLMFAATPDDEQAPLLAKPVRTETIREAVAAGSQPVAAAAEMNEISERAPAGAAAAETPAGEVTLLRPVGESRTAASIQPAERSPLMQGQPPAGAAEASGTVKAPDRLIELPAPEAPAGEATSGPQESRVRMTAPAAPPADGASDSPSSRPSAAAGEAMVTAVPTPLAEEELVARTGTAAEEGGSEIAAPGSADRPESLQGSDLHASTGDGAPGEAAAAGREATRSAPVTAAVNLRAGPDNDAAVLAVVPAGGQVEVIGCEHWCEVVFAGERGWIYKSFVRGADS